MLRYVLLTIALQAWQCHAACRVEGKVVDGVHGVDWTVKTVGCSQGEHIQFYIADQVLTDDQDLDYCSDFEVQPLCPKECNTVVRAMHPATLFACIDGTDAGECAAHNVRTPFANPESNRCEACIVPNCKSCSSHEKCTQCFEGFFMNDDETECVFSLDQRLHLVTVLPAIVGVLLLIIFLHIGYRCCRGKAPEFCQENLKAIRQGRAHRHFCKVQDWSVEDDNSRSRYPLCTNLHRKNICGVGLGLYYNHLLFQLFVAVACFTFTNILDTQTGMKEFLASFDSTFSKYYADQLETIAFHHVVILGIMYVFLFISSLIFGRMQLVYAQWFDSIDTGMEDYVVCVKDLPKYVAPNEGVLKEDLEKAFKALVPEVELHGISIAYDFLNRQDEVERVIANFVQQKDIDAGRYAEELTREKDNKRNLLAAEEDDKNTVRSWFTTKPLSMTGVVFAVFNYKTHEEKIIEEMEKRGGKMQVKLRDRDQPVTVRVKPELMEPPTVFWWSLAFSYKTIVKRFICACIKMLIAVIIVAIVIFIPIGHFLIMPFAKTGTPPSAGLMLLAGIIMGIIYGQFFINTANVAHSIGFHRKDSMDACIFVLFFCVVSLNALFQMGSMIRGAINWPVDMDYAELFGIASIRAILRQPQVVSNVYSFMMPGLFLMPKILEPLGAGLVPYILNQLFAAFVYVWGLFPGPLGMFFKVLLPFAPDSKTNYHPRNAEQAMNPLEIPLPFSYADNVLVNCICFFMLIFISDDNHLIYKGMIFWSIFLYLFSRWAHLRFNKRAFFTTNSLDVTAMHAWGLPLSVLAMAWGTWAMRYVGFTGRPWLPLAGVFVLSFLLWNAAYLKLRRLKRPGYEEQDLDIPYAEARLTKIYSWFNCNPVYVLKSHYCHDLLGNHVKASGASMSEVCYFEVGKEYQCIPKARQQLMIRRAAKTDMWEMEHWLDRIFGAIERGCCCCRSKICCVIDRGNVFNHAFSQFQTQEMGLQ